MIGTTSSKQQDHRHRRRNRPVAVGEELVPQGLADHQRLRAAEQVGDDELADRRDEHQQAAGDDARQRQRKGDLPEGGARRAAEILRGLDQRIVHLLQRRIERQHHEGQIGIDDADEDRRVGVHDDQRLVDDVQRQQQLVEQPFGLQDADPGIDADQEAGPERQDDQHQQDRPQGRRRARHAVGDRIADDQRQDRRDAGDDHARQIGVEVERVLGQPGVVVGGQFPEAIEQPRNAVGEIERRNVGRHGDRRLRQRYLEDDDERDEEEDQQPKIGNGDDQAAGDGGDEALHAAAPPISSARRRRPAGTRPTRGRSSSTDRRSGAGC